MKYACFALIIFISNPMNADTGDYDEDQPQSYQFNVSRVTNSSGVIEDQPPSYQFNVSRVTNSPEVVEDQPQSYQFNVSRVTNSSGVIEDQPPSYQFNVSRVTNSSEVIEDQPQSYQFNLGGVSDYSEVNKDDGVTYLPKFGQPIGIAYGVMFGVGSALIYGLTRYISPWEVRYKEDYLAKIAGLSGFLKAVVAAPVIEEPIVRTPIYMVCNKLILPVVTKKDAEDLVIPASIISGIIFAILHYPNYQKNALVMLAAQSFVGSFYGVLYENQGVLSTLSAHFTNNFIFWWIFKLNRDYPSQPISDV